MVRYGGPRFEFYSINQHLNNEQMIRKEDAQRVASILQRREREAAPPKQKPEQQQSGPPGLSGAAAAPVPPAPGRAAAAAAGSARQRRLCALAAPVSREPGRGGAGYAGRVMYPCAKGVTFPGGRCGAEYMPGVDRHRIVPNVSTSGRAPWVGSGVEWIAEEAAERAEKKYLFSKLKRSMSEARDTAQRVDGIERYHRAQAEKTTKEASPEAERAERDGDDNTPDARRPTEVDTQNERPPSVFSHASSNAPIRALGTRHMDAIVEKEDVQRHLTQYGGVITQPRVSKRPPTPFDDKTLAEVTERLVRMQSRLR